MSVEVSLVGVVSGLKCHIHILCREKRCKHAYYLNKAGFLLIDINCLIIKIDNML